MLNAGTVVRTLLPSIIVLTAILGSVSTPATADSRHGGFKTPLVIGHRGGATGTSRITRLKTMRSASSWAPTLSSPISS
jgi:hypothetical protein